jgi:hypothetical protein
MKKNLLTLFVAACGSLLSLTATAAAGGPDSFGYTFKDSNEPGGPVYNWIEIATPLGGGGTLRTALACDDCHEAAIPLGFDFPFYGTNFNQITMGSNGTVYFENVYLGLGNSCIPGTPGYTMAQYNFIAHLWDDLAPNYQGGVYTQAFPNYFVIEYSDIVPCCATGDGDSWQVILFKNGNILMQYKELSAQGLEGDLTVGIQNNPTTGLQYICDGTGTALASGRAILFSPPTFTCSTISQDILASNAYMCAGASINLTAGGTAIAQTWSTAEFTNSISVSTAGTYALVALDTNGCSLSDAISVSTASLPVVALGSDVTQCGGSVTLDAGNAGNNYLWNTTATTQTISANSTGTYSVSVTDAVTGCVGTDAIDVTINPNPTVALGMDVTQCEGTVTLDAGNAGANFSWSTTESTQTITVSATGTYSVTVTDAVTACSSTDAIDVTINANPVVALGSDITQCGGSVNLDASNAGANYSWSTAETSQVITVSSTGTYSVTVTDAVTGCAGTDMIDVTINTVPTVTFALSVDTVCSADNAFVLTGGSPAGGTYSGAGVNAGNFEPSTAPMGTSAITYTYVDANSCSDVATQYIYVDVCAGISENSVVDAVIYPNPSSGAVYISIPAGSTVVEVYNATGQLVVSKSVNAGTTSIEMENKENGIYFVKISNGSTVRMEKIVLQK